MDFTVIFQLLRTCFFLFCYGIYFMVIFMHEFSSIWKDAGNLSTVLIFYFIFKNVYSYPVCNGCYPCLHVCASCVHNVCWGQEEGVRFSVAADWVLGTGSGPSAKRNQSSKSPSPWLTLSLEGAVSQEIPDTVTCQGWKADSPWSLQEHVSPDTLSFKPSKTHFGILTSRIVTRAFVI